MSASIDQILTDLPQIQAIANRPHVQNPLIAVILQQGLALAEISQWAQAAAQIAAQAQPPAESVALVPVPDAPHEPVVASRKNGAEKA